MCQIQVYFLDLQKHFSWENLSMSSREQIFYHFKYSNIVRFCVQLALFKCDFLRDERTKSWTSWSQIKAENMRNLKVPRHVQIGASKPEL